MTGTAWQRERILATARVVLATSGLFAIWLDDTEPARFAAAAYTLLAAYVAWSLLVLVLLRWPRAERAALPRVLHGVDLAWVTAVSLFTSGPSSPFFLYFVFVLTAAAFRWGMRGALGSSALAAAALVLVSAALAIPGGRFEAPFELNRTIIRWAYVLILGYLVGFLGESEIRHRRESEARLRVLSRLRSATGVESMARAFLGEVRELLEARAVAAIVRDATGTPWLWCLREDDTRATRTPLPREAARQALPAGDALVAERFQAALEAGRGWRPVLPAGVPAPRRTLLAVSFRAVQDAPPVLLLAVDPVPDDDGALRVLARLAEDAAPAFENADLLRKLRSRAGALERSRIARELHDGVLQTLSGLELEIEALRRRGAAESSPVGETLRFIQQQLHAEGLAIRELMDAVRPVDVRPGELLEYLSRTVDRFRAATGIDATFDAQTGDVGLSEAVCRELVKVVQEALVNVRRHAEARRVLVRVSREPGLLVLAVDDNGRGFPFEGRFEHEELERSRHGPVVLRERVRALGGRMSLESVPGRGSRVEVRVPAPSTTSWKEAS